MGNGDNSAQVAVHRDGEPLALSPGKFSTLALHIATRSMSAGVKIKDMLPALMMWSYPRGRHENHDGGDPRHLPTITGCTAVSAGMGRGARRGAKMSASPRGVSLIGTWARGHGRVHRCVANGILGGGGVGGCCGVMDLALCAHHELLRQGALRILEGGPRPWLQFSRL